MMNPNEDTQPMPVPPGRPSHTRLRTYWLIGVVGAAVIVLITGAFAGFALGRIGRPGSPVGSNAALGTGATDTPLSTATAATTATPTTMATAVVATPTSPPPAPPTASPTASTPWYLLPWPSPCRCQQGNITLQLQPPNWWPGRTGWIIVATTPSVHIQLLITYPNGLTSQNNPLASVVDSSGNWGLQLTFGNEVCPGGTQVFSHVQVRTEAGAYADATAYCGQV